jgi:glyoxylase-like metal-dependent hydrolase (beta-lactamase superfamily II)
VALDVAKAAGFYAADYRFQPVEVAREVREGDRIPVGSLEMEVFETPGHCDGHVSLLLRGRERRYLLAGDAVFSGGRVVLQNIHDCSIQKSAESIAKLAQIEFDALLPGHAAICLDGGMRHVAIANAACQSLFVPKNLVG